MAPCAHKNCGLNAQCRIGYNGQPHCYCPRNYPKGDPNIECNQELSVVDCRTNGCGLNGECLREGAEFVCRCIPGTEGQADVECHTSIECTSDKDCPVDKACLSLHCVDPCTIRGVCGEDALCVSVMHRAQCSCPQCYVGQPRLACRLDPTCKPTVELNTTITCSDTKPCPPKLACDESTNQCHNPCMDYQNCRPNQKCELDNAVLSSITSLFAQRCVNVKLMQIVQDTRIHIAMDAHVSLIRLLLIVAIVDLVYPVIHSQELAWKMIALKMSH
ncbi:unnamed protein product, partial [Iphiclides podalirius]